MGTHRDSYENGRNPLRGIGGLFSPQNGNSGMSHSLSWHPGGRYGQRKEQRRQECAERQAYRDGLSPQEQLDRLNTRLGEGIGAQKERARLHAQIRASLAVPDEECTAEVPLL